MATASHEIGGARFVARRARKWLDSAPSTTWKGAAFPVIDLGRGELDRATAPHIVVAAAAALDCGETHYTPRPGILPLRRGVAAMIIHESDIEYDPATEVLIANGGQEGLFVAVQMLVQPGDDVLLADPWYSSYREAIRLAGGNVVSVPISARDHYGMTATALAAHITPRTHVLVLVSPDNPTGGVTMHGEMERIAAFAVTHDLTVLSDETYKAFVFDGAAHTRIATFPGMRARTVIVGSFSKTYAMTGWRVGYVAAAAELLEPITDLKLALSICSAAPSQWAAVAALEGPQEHVQEALAEMLRRRAVLLPALAAMGLPHGDPQGAYYAFADIRGTGLSSSACADLFLSRAGVRTLPGDRFGPGGEGFLRFSMVQPVPTVKEAMARLAPLVRELQTVHERGLP